jgi:predicted Zn-dependent protease
MLSVADTPDQLAAVIGHELGHVQSKHGAERVSQQFAAQAAMTAVQVYQSTQRSGDSGTVMGLLGIGATLGVLLPYSRLHEREADLLGQKLMARAGYDPNAAATLWQDMQARESTRLPQFLSTHPDPANRAASMSERAPSLQADYDAARAAGLGSACVAPRAL